MEFFLDLWSLNPYHSEKALGDAVKASFAQCKAAVAKAIAKDIKANLNLMHYKKRSLTSGKKCPILKEFFDLLEDKQPQQTSSSSSLAPSSSYLAPFSLAPSSSASAPVLPVKATPPSALAIAKLYGFSSQPELPPSQITVSDESLHEEDLPVEAWKGYYFDYQAMCLVRFSADGKTEMSEMQPGPNGFALAKFRDDSIQETTVPNLDLFEDMAVQKKPSMAKKRPAAALMSEADDAQACSQTSELACVDVAAVLAKADDIPQCSKVSSLFASNKAMLGTGEVLKLGLFRDKSYITYKPPGAEKFTLLVGVSKEQAARNNKHHHSVMREVWDKLRGYTSMPSKADMKALVITLLASKDQ